MIFISATQLKNNVGKYLDMVLLEGEISIVRHKRVIARIVAVKNTDQVTIDDQNNVPYEEKLR